MPKIITIGSATRDCIIPEPGSNLITKSETEIIQQFSLGEKIELEKISFTTGGGATNSAYTFSRQGFKTACFAKIGKDVSGKEILADLKKEKINTDLIKRTEKAPSAYSITLLTPEGRTILVHRGAAANLREEEFNPIRMKADWYYITSLGGQINLLHKIIKQGYKRGVKIALNPGSKEISQKEKILKLLPKIEVLLLNEEEALEISGTDNLDSAFQALSEPTITVITKGKNGSELVTDSNRYKAGIFSEKQFRDRTGAGDAFGSGFVSGYIKEGGDPESTQCLQEGLRLGAANSTAIVEHLGAKDQILSSEKFKQSRWKDFTVEVSNRN